MAANIVLKNIVAWIAVLQQKDMKKTCFESKGNDLAFPCECLLYYVPVRSYKARNLQERERNLVFLM